MSADIEQFRPGFEAWWNKPEVTTGRAPCNFMDEQTARATWIASKREASTEPVEYALLRNGKVEGVERTIQCARMWVDAEIAPLFMDAAGGAQKDEAKDAARYRWLRDKSEPGICAFYLSVGQAFKGVKFARDTVDEAIDSAIATSTSKGEESR